MENKINIAEILKDCPQGMALDSTMWDNLYFDRVDNDLIHCYYELDGHRNTTMFCKNGCYTAHKLSKCVIFPKGKTTWEGFVPPCKFKDGDVLSYQCQGYKNRTIYIYMQHNKMNTTFYVALSGYSDSEFIINEKKEYGYALNGYNDTACLASDEEKQKLFDAIKANGYHWNDETKTLEKLVEPKFKVGDIIQDNGYEVEITKVNVEDELYEYKSINTKVIGSIAFNKQDYWELVSNKFDVTTLKPFKSEVLVRDNVEELWFPCFFGGLSCDNHYPYRTVGGEIWKCCIPYEGNEHLLGKKEDCDNYYKNW